MIRRRQLLIALGAAGLVPGLSIGQQATKRVAMLVAFPEADSEARREVAAFREELQRLGWSEGRNLHIDERWAAGDFGRVGALAKEVVALRPDVIVCRATPTSKALLRETRSIPIVFLVVSDPIGDGLVASMARPGGNVTGFIYTEESLGGKWLELLREIKPKIERVAVLFNPKTAPGGGDYYLRVVQQAAEATGVRLSPCRASSAAEIQNAIEEFARQPNGGLLVMPDATNTVHRKLIIALADRHRMTAIYPIKAFVNDGGLAAYGPDVVDIYRRGAAYVDRILRGAKPAELPVQAPTKFELTVNQKTAQAQGIAIPRALMLRADRVIE